MKTKELLFEIARWLIVLVAVIHLVLMFGTNTVSNAQPEVVCNSVMSVLDSTNMQLGDNQMIKRLYGLNPADYDSCILYYPMTNMMAEEILIVKLNDTSQQEDVVAAVQARLDTQKNTFEGYGVEQFDLLTNYSVIEVRGNFVLFSVSKNVAEDQKAFLNAL